MSTRTYEIVTTEGTVRMDIPEEWKVTYGPVSPGTKFGSAGGNALRVYEGENKQRAIFLDVLSFRDLSIPMLHLMVKTTGSERFEVDRNGSSRRSKTVVERKWVTDEEFQNLGEAE